MAGERRSPYPVEELAKDTIKQVKALGLKRLALVGMSLVGLSLLADQVTSSASGLFESTPGNYAVHLQNDGPGNNLNYTGSDLPNAGKVNAATQKAIKVMLNAADQVTTGQQPGDTDGSRFE